MSSHRVLAPSSGVHIVPVSRPRPTIQLVTTTHAPTGRGADELPTFVREFLDGRSPLTARRYAAALRQFARWRERPAGVAIGELVGGGESEARRLAWRYRTALMERGYAASTINVALASLVAAALAARRVGAIDWALDVEPLPIQSYRDTRGPGTDGVRALLSVAGRRIDARIRARDVCAIQMLFALGLRRNELLQIDLTDLERDRGDSPVSVWIRGKARTADERLSLPIGARRALKEWLRIRGEAPGPLFISLSPSHRQSLRRLTGDGLAHVLRTLSVMAALPRRATPHGIRHACISAALDRGTDLRDCAKFSRHRNLNTLVTYDDARRDIAGQVARRLDGLLD